MLAGLGVVGLIYGIRALPWERIFPPELDFADIPGLAPFRRLVLGSESGPSAGLMLVGLDGPVPTDESADMADLRADPCPALFGAAAGGTALPIAYFREFRCPYCRALERDLAPVLAEDPGGLTLVQHEWPVFGAESELAARAFLAAARQGAQQKLSQRLMQRPVVADPQSIRRAAEAIGLDAKRLMADMAAPGIDAQLARSRALAQLFGFIGTPGLVIGRTALNGAISRPLLERLIEDEKQLPAVCPVR